MAVVLSRACLVELASAAALLNLAGQVCAGAGLVAALFGESGLNQQLFPGRLLPLARTWNGVVRWISTHILGREPRQRRIELSGRIGGSGDLRIAVLESLPTRPATDVPSEAWIRYLVRYVENLDRRLAREVDKSGARISRLQEQFASEIGSLGARIGTVDKGWREALGGNEGRGLDLTWGGLFIALIGVALQLLAAVCDLAARIGGPAGA
jgi:hypothetical protein